MTSERVNPVPAKCVLEEERECALSRRYLNNDNEALLDTFCAATVNNNNTDQTNDEGIRRRDPTSSVLKINEQLAMELITLKERQLNVRNETTAHQAWPCPCKYASHYYGRFVCRVVRACRSQSLPFRSENSEANFAVSA